MRNAKGEASALPPVSAPTIFSVRAPVMADLEAVNELIRGCEAHEEGEAELEVDDLRGAWERPRFDLSRDAWVIATSKSAIVGYIDVWDREPNVRYIADGYVHPRWRGRGIGTQLVRLAEAGIRERLHDASPATGAVIQHIVFHGSEESRRLLKNEGYSPVAYFWRMVKYIDSPPAEPRLPGGVTIRTFELGQDEQAVYELVQDAFTDNAEYARIRFEEWAAFMLARESFDPSLYFLAVVPREPQDEPLELAGVALCPRYETMGWVRQLAVRREWRGRGVGRALMQRVFADFYRRGQRKVGLVVDSYNRTGAKQFYESLGMCVERQHDRYEKALDPSLLRK